MSGGSRGSEWPADGERADSEQSGDFRVRRSQLLDILAAVAGMLSRGGMVDVDATLRLIGQAVEADRMYLFENHVDPLTGRTLCSQRFEWADGSVTAEIDNPHLQNLPYEQVSDKLLEVHGRGEVFSGFTRNMEPKMRSHLERQGIISVCSVPVTLEGQLWGFLGFDDCHRERVWSDDEVAVLRLVAAILGGHFSRERIRAALAASEAQYRYLVDNVHEVIFECGLDGCMTFLNSAWERRLGHTVAEGIGEKLQRFVVPEARERAVRLVDEAAEAEREGFFGEMPFLHRNGDERWMQVLSRFQRDEDGAVTGMIGTMTDVTEHKRAEQALQRQQLDQSLSTLAGGIAHDFNNVLHGMLAAADVLRRYHAEDERSGELLSVVQASGERMADMTRQLLAYARGGRFESTLLDPVRLVEDALKIGRGRVPSDVRLDFDVVGFEACVEGDRGQMFQVILNLVVNAVEAMEKGGVLRIAVREAEVETAHALVRTGSLAPGPYVVLTFADEGPGIPPDVLPRIFEPFFSTKSQGRGLGLAAARGIIGNHGGAIGVTSEPGRGATFEVHLPKRHGAVPRSKKPSARPAAPGALVLVVDDEEAVLRVTKTILEEAGYRVLVAAGGREAIELFERHQQEIHAVLVDYLMPDMDGAAVIRVLRERSPDRRLILCTGYDRDELVAAGPDLEGVPRLEKPFSRTLLLTALAHGEEQGS